MPRLVQSTLVPGSASAWLDVLREESRTVALASAAPTLTLRLLPGHDAIWTRHELVHGFFRTSWTCRVETLDEASGVFLAKVEGTIFSAFRHEMRWETTAEGLIVRSDVSWEGARPSLEQILSQSLVRFPLPAGQAPAFADSPTRRMILDDRAFGAA